MSRRSIDQQITFIYCENLQVCSQFYEDTLGLPLWRDQGTCRIYQVSSTSFLGICQVGEHSKGRITSGLQQNIIITLITPDVDALYHSLRQKGVEFENEPEVNSIYSIYHCFLRDPQGYMIEIQRFLD